MIVASLSNIQVFWLGAFGGLLALAITQVLPSAIAIARTGIGPTITFWRVLAVLIIVGIFVSAGGGAAILVGGATEAKTAILYGLAWEAILGGAIKSGKAVIS